MTATIESKPTETSFHLVARTDSSSSETPSPSNWQSDATTDQPQRPPDARHYRYLAMSPSMYCA
jgi:hypothetical protein